MMHKPMVDNNLWLLAVKLVNEAYNRYGIELFVRVEDNHDGILFYFVD